MAGLQKPGLDYFSFDTTLDRKFEIYEAKHGLIGFGIIVKILQRIYGENGYYIEFKEIDALLLGSRYGLSAQEVLTFIQTAVEQGIFHGGIYEQHSVLTSHGIQIRYLKGMARRKKVEMQKEYLLLSAPEIPENVYIHGENVYNNAQNVCNNPTKESKVNKNKTKVDETKVEVVKENPATASNENIYRHFERCFGIMSQTAMQEMDSFIESGVEPEMIRAIFDEAVDQGKPNWSYARVILHTKVKKGIKTLAAFQRDQAQYRKQKEKGSDGKKSKFNNYEDTNTTDYAQLEDKLLDRMLEGEDT